MGETQIRVLGPIEVVDAAGDAVSLPPQPARLLALLMASGGSATRDEIAEYITDGDPSGSAVRTCVARLRKALGGHLDREGTRYRLDLGASASDAAEFRSLVSSASGERGSARIALLADAVALWRGPAFGEFANEHWALAEAARLERERTNAAEDLAESLIDHGEPDRAVPLLEAHVVERPLAERPVALLMQALAHTGQAAHAARAYQRFRAELAEVGLEPSGALADLERRILSGSTDDATAVTRTDGDPDSLPAGIITFVFTDIVGSTRLWDRDQDAMASSLRLHDQISDEVMVGSGGHVFHQAGDGRAVAFSSPRRALSAAQTLQAKLSTAEWPGPQLTVRIGIHMGDAEPQHGDYLGPPVNLAARVAAAAHGGQILATSAVRDATAFDGVDLGSHHLRGVSEPTRLWQVGTASPGPMRVDALVPVNLPAARSRLIGRDDALQHLEGLLADSRLVTITGAGGAGKTRLAVEVARRSVGRFPGGVHFVDLTLVEDPQRIRHEFLRSLGVDEGADDLRHALSARGGDPTLLVVDNCEHLLDPIADLVDDLLSEFDHLAVLATSREALDIDGERTMRLRSLAVEPDGPAVDLFVERARDASPDFEPDADGRESVAAVCAELDGMPLAIEMAAARLRSMTLPELRDGLDERFTLLSGGRGRARRRQHTLDAVVAWSHDLLDPDEQTMLRRLAVFGEAFDADLAAAVCEVSPARGRQMLDSLVAKSLVEFASVEGHARFWLLETIRLFAVDRLVADDAPDAVRLRLADALIARWNWGSYADDLFLTGGQDDLAGLHRDYGHLRRSALWCVSRSDWLRAGRLMGVGRLGMSDDQVWKSFVFPALEEGEVRDALAEDPSVLRPLESVAVSSAWSSFMPASPNRETFERLERRQHAEIEEALASHGSVPIVPLHRYASDLVPDRIDDLVAWADTDRSDPVARAMANHAAPALVLCGEHYRACQAALDGRPSSRTPGRRAAWGSTTAYVLTAAGRAREALEILDETDVLLSGNTAAGMRRSIARTAPLITLGRAEEAIDPYVAETKTRFFAGLTGHNGVESTYLAIFAWLHHEAGDSERARLLIDHTVKRFLPDWMMICHVKSIIAGWSAEEFQARWTCWHDTHVAAGDLLARCEAMSDLLQEELRHWS